jgi:hypothetical protein
MNAEKVVTMIPWTKVMQLIAKLIKFGKGGISKDEAAELAEDLLLLAAGLIEASKK